MRASLIMKLFLLATLTLAVSLTLELTTFAQRGDQAPLPPPKPQQATEPVLDLGKVEGSTYTNRYFGISLKAPKGWTILDVSATSMRQNAKDLVRDEKNQNFKRGMEESVDRTTALFSAFKLPQGSQFNAVLVCLAERVPTAIVKTPRDYYNLMLNTFKLSEEVQVEVIEPFRTKKIGAKEFGTYTIKLSTNAGVLMQKQLITVKSAYALGIVFNYTEESDLRSFDETIDSIRVN